MCIRDSACMCVLPPVRSVQSSLCHPFILLKMDTMDVAEVLSSPLENNQPWPIINYLIMQSILRLTVFVNTISGNKLSSSGPKIVILS